MIGCAAEHQAIVDGRKPLKACSPAVKSWFRLHLFLEACKILDIPELEERRAAIDEHPGTYREELKAEILRLWKEHSK